MAHSADHSNALRIKPLFKEKELWFLILVGVLYFYRPLFLQETFYFRDLYLDILPHKKLLAEFIHNRELPLWNIYLNGGQPYLADLAYFPCYPSNVLYMFCSLLTAFNVNIVGHYITGAVSAYLLARILGFHPISSFMTGIIYSFSGYALSLANLAGRCLVLPHIPLLFLCWHLFLLKKKKRWFVGAIVFGVCQVLAGAPETNIISLLLLLGWTVWYPYPAAPLLRRIIWWGMLAIFIMGIAAFQLVPTLEMSLLSTREAGVNYSEFSTWSLHPKRMLEFIFPGFLGHVDHLPHTDYYWGGKLVNDWNPNILSIYFGCITLFLAGCGVVTDRKKDVPLPHGIRIYLSVLIVGSLILALGRFLPFFHLFFQYIPFIQIFRYPIKFLIAALLPLALLAGYGSDVHFGHKMNSLKPQLDSPKFSAVFLSILWGIAGIFLLLTLLFSYSPLFAEGFQQAIFRYQSGEISRQGITDSLVHATAIWVLTVLLYQSRALQYRSYQHWILACIVLLDLLLAGNRINFYGPRELFKDTPPLASTLQKNIGEGRLFRTGDPKDFSLSVPKPYPDMFQLPYNSFFWGIRWNFEMFFLHLSPFYKIPTIFHITLALGSKRMATLTRLVSELSWEQRVPLLSAANVYFIVTSDQIKAPGLQQLGKIPNWSDLPLYLYRNDLAMKRIEFVSKWKVADSDANAIHILLEPHFDPRQEAIIQPPDSPLFFSLFQQIETVDIAKYESISSGQSHLPGASQICSDATIKTLHTTTHSVHVSVSNSCDGFLVFSEQYYPGWYARIDGYLSPIFRANYAFSAVFLPSGTHEIEKYYRPDSLILGIMCSIIFCISLSIILVICRHNNWHITRKDNGLS